MRFRLLETADRVAHLLYEPAAFGKPCVAYKGWRKRFLGRVRLIPERWFTAVCDRHEAAITGETT